MVTDSVADSLIRIKNGYLAHKAEVNVPYSKVTVAITDLLAKEGYIEKVKVETNEKNGFKTLVATLRYQGRHSALTDVKRVSRPSLRVYKGADSLPWVLNGLGIAIISTPKGVMTDKQARKQGLGGEVMAYVW